MKLYRKKWAKALALVPLPLAPACGPQFAAEITPAKKVEKPREDSASPLPISDEAPTTAAANPQVTSDVAPSTTSTVAATITQDEGPAIEPFAVWPATPEPDDASWWRSQPGYTGTLPPDYIRQCESGGDYGAVNGSSGAGGAWQVMPGTWDGYGGYERAEDAPPAVQDAKAAELWANGAGSWHWSPCL